ncbi:MAG: Chlamydia protein [Chlamydiota bacterium]|jgi:hypothetical protein
MAHQVSGIPKSSMQSLWGFIAEKTDSELEGDPANLTDDLLASLDGSNKDKVKAFIETCGGLASLIDFNISQAQLLCPGTWQSNKAIESCIESGLEVEKFDCSEGRFGDLLYGIIYYPKDFNKLCNSSCALYHNPNGITIAQYFVNGQLTGTPAEIVKLFNCPLVMYDYRGTGLNSSNTSRISTEDEIDWSMLVQDGKTILRYALEKFSTVNVIGSALGGGVATVSLERYLTANPTDRQKVALINHDSFSTSAAVAFPRYQAIANCVGWALNSYLDAKTSMKELIKHEVAIIVLCHNKDPIIPEKARMADLIGTQDISKNTRVFRSTQYGHGNFSSDMVSAVCRIADVAGKPFSIL